ncbi:MAG: hypothetical protein JST92_09520 [Deltaproteobacteria bacterium]|nr:hypothetical protein [Deltaproteobacteria bacterium]
MAQAAKDYVETLARELSRSRAGLVLSPADAQLALSWHAAGLPLAEVVLVVRAAQKAMKSRGGGTARGALELPVSLQAVRPRVEAMLAKSLKAQRKLQEVQGRRSLADELFDAARAQRLPAQDGWLTLARESEGLLKTGVEAFWTRAIAAMRASLHEMPRQQRVQVGLAVRARRGQRPRAMAPARYRRTLQMQMLAAGSELFQVPPKPFLL